MKAIDRILLAIDKVIAVGDKIRAIEAHLYFVKASKVARHLPDLKKQYELLWREHDELFNQYAAEWKAKHGSPDRTPLEGPTSPC